MGISQEIANLPVYKGEAWRAESGYGHGRHDTAGDLIRFERDELENDFGLSEELIKELDQYHASDLTWVTRKRQQCLRYLSEGESDECVGQQDLGSNPRIVVDTDEEGVLVLRGDAIPMSQYAQTTKQRYRTRIVPLFEGHRQEDKAFNEYMHAASQNQAYYFLGFHYPYPQYVVETPVEDPEVVMQPQTGTCYQDAFRYLKEHEDATLVHGTAQHITREGIGRTGHAWVELPDGTIWEPENKLIITKEQFEISKPEVIKRYNFTAAAIEILKHSHYGPWHEEKMPKTEQQKSHFISYPTPEGSTEAFRYPNRVQWAYVGGIPGLDAALGHYDTRTKMALIFMIRVKEESRLRGIGRQAVKELEDWLAKQGVKRIRGHAKEGSEGFWKALGYTIGAERSGHLPVVNKDLLPQEKKMPQTVVEEPPTREVMGYPTLLTMVEYEQNWKPHGWNIIFIGPTSTWRQDWGAWEAIRDIVQNTLDETEAYQWGYDENGLWIADQGRGVAVADFLLGPPKLKPDYARGKFGEGMKIAALAMVRDGYPVVIKTVRRELRIVFLEQDVGGSHVESLAALWRPNGTDIGTTFQFIGYNGDAFPERFAVNLPRDAILFQGNSLINEPRTRFNQLIDTQKVIAMKQGLSIFPQQSVIYARDIYMTDINSLYSYNLWDFELAPDRFAPKQASDMYRSMGRLWATCEDPELLKILLQMVKDPPIIETAESHQIEIFGHMMGTNPATGISYVGIMKQNQWAWQKAWDEVYGEAVVLRTDEKWDAMVRHLGYESTSVSWNVAESFRSIFKKDADLITESQDRLRDIEVIRDEKLTERERIHLILARAIADSIARHRRVGGVHAAIIPPASDRVRTAGLYGRSTEEIFIAADQLRRGRTVVDTTIHELAHHTTGAEDGEEAHNRELTRLGGIVVELTSQRYYDDIIGKPDFMW